MSSFSAKPVSLLPSVLGLHSVVDMVVATLDIRDPYTSEHSHRVAGLAELLAEAMALSPEQCRLVHYAAHLHDIGKIGVSDSTLNKIGKLTAEEMAEMQAHSEIGAMILSKNPEFTLLAEIVRHHHERWDGKGYPDGISGDAIPLESRIIGLADAFDAMTSDRPYRAHKTHEWALEEIKKHAGSQFCPECVSIFLTLRAKLKLNQYQSSKRAFSHHQANVRHHTLMHSQRIRSMPTRH
ncbi:HD-GYP domain-containing protein [Desulfotalea psychrophila]|uniref:HD-GYP domain-containing protein n=1 Tax=Desulfotalea psychrophila TaxID=84980 RepID=UPI0012EAF237|nr:HD-GYP domain-containing protein [Desulfotalea psychrophila]